MYKLKWSINFNDLAAYYEPTDILQMILSHHSRHAGGEFISTICFGFASRPSREPLDMEHDRIILGDDYVRSD